MTTTQLVPTEWEIGGYIYTLDLPIKETVDNATSVIPTYDQIRAMLGLGKHQDIEVSGWGTSHLYVDVYCGSNERGRCYDRAGVLECISHQSLSPVVPA